MKKLRADLEEALEDKLFWMQTSRSQTEELEKLNNGPCQDCFIKDFKLAMLERKCGGAATGACKAEGCGKHRQEERKQEAQAKCLRFSGQTEGQGRQGGGKARPTRDVTAWAGVRA